MTTDIKKGLDELDAALDPISDEALEKLAPKMSELLPRERAGWRRLPDPARRV